MKKQYVIRKYIMAENAAEALRNEKKVKPDEVWLDDDWKKSHIELFEPAKPKIGFNAKEKK